MINKKILLLLSFLFLISGCSFLKRELTIDATNDQTLKTSVEKIAKSMPREKQMEFGKAIGKVAIMSLYDCMKTKSCSKETVKNKIHGKTADEVIQMASQINDVESQKMSTSIMKDLIKINKNQ